MNTINCSCGKPSKGCGCCRSCDFNPCAVTCGSTFECRADYAYIFNTTAQTVAAGEAVTFSGNGPLSGTITHTAGTAEIVIGNTGVYLINFYVAPTAEAQFTVYRNGAPTEGGTYVGDGGNIILAAQVGDVITVVNTGAAEAVFEAAGTVPEAVVNAAVTVTRLF